MVDERPHSLRSLAARLSVVLRWPFVAYAPAYFATRTTQSIIDELVELYRTYGFIAFMFYDDELNVSKTMVELMNAIANKQQELGVQWRLRGFIKAELFTESQAAAMYRAGFRQIIGGFRNRAPLGYSKTSKSALTP